MATTTSDLADGVWYAARPSPIDSPASAMPSGTMQHEPPGEADAGLLGRGVLAALDVGDPVLDQRRQAPVEVGAADLVGDEQRLAGGVGGGVGQAGLQHASVPVEVGREQPLALGGLERGPQLVRARAGRPRTAPGGPSGRATPVRRRISSIIRGHASLRPRAAAPPAGPVGRDRVGGGEGADRQRGQRAAEQGERDGRRRARTATP